MQAPSSGIRGFLGRKKRHQPPQSQSQSQPPQEPQPDESARSDRSAEPQSHTSSSNVSAEATDEPHEQTEAAPAADSQVAMEGPLKKRGAKMPVMHDRYCVATWELDAQDRKCVMLRSYKSHKAYDAHPERPASVHQLKCISEWDGKTGFHRYTHAFSMETRDKKVFQCVAPSAADKDKWVELMALQTAFDTSSSRDMRLGSVGSLVPLRRTASVDSRASTKPRAYTSASTGVKARGLSTADAQSTDSEGQGRFLGHDGLFRSTSGASSGSMDLTGSGKTGEPADWGLYGETDGTTTGKSRYDVVDGEDEKNLLLDKELLDARGAKSSKTLANDAYLFEDTGVSRFGAVVVQGAADSDDDSDEFVDEELAARQAREKSEKQMRRRAQKLESNKDLYAEMAAARLNDMRKDARQPVKKPSEGHDSDSDSQSEAAENETLAELEEVATSRRSSSRSHRSSSKAAKKSSVSSGRDSSQRGYVSEEEEEEEEPETTLAEGLTEAERQEAEELRQLQKQHKAERRAKRRQQRQKEEEERAALQAAELARAHREEQREREAAKAREEQEKRDKKERREMKEKLKREKARQRQAEAELRKLVELKQAEEEKKRRKDAKEAKKEAKKSKKKEKYTPPADRIHKKEERAAAAATATATATATDVSSALVVVDKPEEVKETPAPAAAVPTPTPTPAPISAPAPAPVQPEAPKSAPTVATSPVSSAQVPAPPQSLPMYQVTPPPFVPAYPTAPASMPAYGLAQTFGAYAMPYGTLGMGAPMGAQTAFARPPLGFMAGLSMGARPPPMSPQKEATVERMIGPQLPTEEERKKAGTTATATTTSDVKLSNLPDLPDVEEF